MDLLQGIAPGTGVCHTVGAQRGLASPPSGPEVPHLARLPQRLSSRAGVLVSQRHRDNFLSVSSASRAPGVLSPWSFPEFPFC